METDVDMETLDAVLDVFQKVGLELIVKLGPVLIALLAMLWGVRYVKRQFSAAKDSIVSVPSRALKGAAHAGQNLSAKAAAAASAAAQQIGGLAVDHALPVAQKAALVAVDGAKAGADQVVSGIAGAPVVDGERAGDRGRELAVVHRRRVGACYGNCGRNCRDEHAEGGYV